MACVRYNSPIRVYGVEFEDIYEVIRYSGSGKAKEGVYVDDDSQRYPCFDYEDYASENRYYWNFVFAKSKKELEKKMEALRKMDSSTNYPIPILSNALVRKLNVCIIGNSSIPTH